MSRVTAVTWSETPSPSRSIGLHCRCKLGPTVGQCPTGVTGQAKPARLDQACLAASGGVRAPVASGPVRPYGRVGPTSKMGSDCHQMQSDVLNRHFLALAEFLTNLEGLVEVRQALRVTESKSAKRTTPVWLPTSLFSNKGTRERRAHP